MPTLNGRRMTIDRKTVISLNGSRVYTPNGAGRGTYNGRECYHITWNGNRFSPPERDSVLYLPGYPGQGSVITDYSGQGNNGTITGAVWKQLPSGFWYLDFDATDDHITHGYQAVYKITAALTLGCWVQTSNTGISLPIDFYRGANGTTYGGYALTLVSGIPRFGTRKDVTTADNFDSTTLVADGTWHRLDAVYDGAKKYIYIDGAEDTSKVWTTDVVYGATFATELWIADREELATTYPFDGNIALPYICSRALTAAKIANNYNKEKVLFGV